MQAFGTGYMQIAPTYDEEESKEEYTNYGIFFVPYNLKSDNRIKYIEIWFVKNASIRELRMALQVQFNIDQGSYVSA